jgi:Fur family ferric uptake transcriptional regulator
MSNKIHACSFDEIIEKNWPEGVKKTRQRVDVYKVLYEAKAPLSAAEIFSALNSNSAKEMYAFSTV